MVAIGFGQHVGERDIGVRAKGGGRTIAGLDEFHPDTQRFEFVREAAGETLDRGLAARIGGCIREGGKRRRRSDVDDRSRPAFAHLRDHRLRHGDSAEAVGGIDVADAPQRRMFERAEQADPRIVDQNVDRPGGGDGGGDAVVIGHIERQQAKPRRRFERRGGRVAHRRDHGPAASMKMARGFEAIARRAAGDQNPFHHSSFHQGDGKDLVSRRDTIYNVKSAFLYQ